jgi:hypothetical protein
MVGEISSKDKIPGPISSLPVVDKFDAVVNDFFPMNNDFLLVVSVKKCSPYFYHL